jgi:hypothetical protein
MATGRSDLTPKRGMIYLSYKHATLAQSSDQALRLVTRPQESSGTGLVDYKRSATLAQSAEQTLRKRPASSSILEGGSSQAVVSAAPRTCAVTNRSKQSESARHAPRRLAAQPGRTREDVAAAKRTPSWRHAPAHGLSYICASFVGQLLGCHIAPPMPPGPPPHNACVTSNGLDSRLNAP